MTDHPSAFFFYGTLMTGQSPLAGRLRPKLSRVVHGSIPGRLVWLADNGLRYPGLVEPDHPHSRVRGVVMTPTHLFRDTDWQAICQWEDYDPADPAGSLYVPLDVTVSKVTGGTMRATAFLYQGPAR